MSLLPSAVILRRRLPLTCLVRSSLAPQRRTMAGAGRNYYIKDGSNPTGITDEVRDLVKNQRTAYNIDEWRKQTGIGEAVRLDNQDDDDIDDDQVMMMMTCDALIFAVFIKQLFDGDRLSVTKFDIGDFHCRVCPVI